MATRTVSVKVCDICGKDMDGPGLPRYGVYENSPGKKAKRLDICHVCSGAIGRMIGPGPDTAPEPEPEQQVLPGTEVTAQAQPASQDILTGDIYKPQHQQS